MINQHRFEHPVPADYAPVLAEGTFWSTAEVQRIAALITDADAFGALWRLLAHPDPLVRVHAGSAAELVSRTQPELLVNASADRLMNGGPELGLHRTPFAAQLALDPDQSARLMRRLEDAVLNHPSTFIRVEALRSAFAMAAENRRYLPRVRALAKDAQKTPCPTLAARARSLLAGGDGLTDG
jgi:hypothetical protein